MTSLTSSRRNLGASASNPTGGDALVTTLPEDLSQLVTACQSGESRAQRQIFDACQPRITRLVLRMVGRQDAPDLVQQTFLQMHRTIQQFSGHSRFETWLYRLAVNECLQFLRRTKRIRCEVLAHDPPDRSASESLHAQEHELLEVAMGRLDDELRGIFVLREIEGLTYREIAEAMGIAEGTVASRLSRARNQIRQHLVELGWDCSE